MKNKEAIKDNDRSKASNKNDYFPFIIFKYRQSKFNFGQKVSRYLQKYTRKNFKKLKKFDF